jgi:osmotically inducible lipoprotein OsmB
MQKHNGYKQAALVSLLGILFGTTVGCSQPLSTREKGALGGAALGAGTGAIFGGGKGAAIGGAAGALGGAIVGDQLQRRENDQEYDDERAREQAARDRRQRELDRERRQRNDDDY